MFGLGDSDDTTPVVAGSRPLVHRTRAIVVHGSLVLFALAIVARAVQIQLVDANRWSSAAETQQVRERAVTPSRGQILDANGNVFVETRELCLIDIGYIIAATVRATVRVGIEKSRLGWLWHFGKV